MPYRAHSFRLLPTPRRLDKAEVAGSSPASSISRYHRILVRIPAPGGKTVSRTFVASRAGSSLALAIAGCWWRSVSAQPWATRSASASAGRMLACRQTCNHPSACSGATGGNRATRVRRQHRQLQAPAGRRAFRAFRDCLRLAPRCQCGNECRAGSVGLPILPCCKAVASEAPIPALLACRARNRGPEAVCCSELLPMPGPSLGL
jgi:hypothetical protein